MSNFHTHYNLHTKLDQNSTNRCAESNTVYYSVQPNIHLSVSCEHFFVLGTCIYLRVSRKIYDQILMKK